MLLHSRLWWFVLLLVVFLLLTTALGAARAVLVPPSPSASVATFVSAPVAALAVPEDLGVVAPPAVVLGVGLLLHIVATAVGLRIGMKVFYESALFRGFCAILAIDAAVVAAMLVAAPLCDDFTASLGPQVVVTLLVMAVTLHHFGFTKDRFTVIPAVLMAKAVGFFAEVVLRMLFLEALLRYFAAAP